MAAKKRSTERRTSALSRKKKVPAGYYLGRGPLSKEETRVMEYYRCLGRWERNALHVLMGNLAWGSLTEEADRLPWPKIACIVGLRRTEARHG